MNASPPACLHGLQDYNSTLNTSKCIDGHATLFPVYSTFAVESTSGEVFPSKRIKVKRFRGLVNFLSGIVFFSQFQPISVCLFFFNKGFELTTWLSYLVPFSAKYRTTGSYGHWLMLTALSAL